MSRLIMCMQSTTRFEFDSRFRSHLQRFMSTTVWQPVVPCTPVVAQAPIGYTANCGVAGTTAAPNGFIKKAPLTGPVYANLERSTTYCYLWGE